MSATPPDATESLRADAAALRTIADRVEAGSVDADTRRHLWLTLASVQRVHNLLGETAAGVQDRTPEPEPERNG